MNKRKKTLETGKGYLRLRYRRYQDQSLKRLVKFAPKNWDQQYSDLGRMRKESLSH